MAEFLVDSYSESNKDNNFIMPTNYSDIGQSFTVSKAGKLSRCQFYLSKSSSPSGNILAKLYAHSGTYGTSSITTGAALATSDAIVASTVGAGYALITFTFSGANQYPLALGYYCINCNYSGAAAINIGEDESSPGHGGNLILGLTTQYAAGDLCFYVYAKTPESGFSGGQPWIFMKDMWDKHKEIWKPKLVLRKDLGFCY